MREKPTFIADGHHRYGTAMMYRDELARRGGALPADHPANFVLCVFCAMEDPGLLILPTHRVLPETRLHADEFSTDQMLEVMPLPAADPEGVVTGLDRFGRQAIALYSATDGEYSVIRPRRTEILDSLEPARSQAWRRLNLAFLHAYLLDRTITPKQAGGTPPTQQREGSTPPTIHYVKSAAAAVEEARASGGSAFLLAPTTMAELRAVCQAGDLMPQKSTFFYPKLASGLVINPLT